MIRYSSALVSEKTAMTAPATHPIPTAYNLFSMGFLTIVAITLLLGVGLIVRHYPFSGWWLALGLTGYAILLWRWPGSWLAALPIALSIFDPAPWTGWFFVEETDFLLIVTLVVGYLQLARVQPVCRLGRSAGLVLTLYALALIISLIRGMLPLPFQISTRWLIMTALTTACESPRAYCGPCCCCRCCAAA
jgi:hypothetical protein